MKKLKLFSLFLIILTLLAVGGNLYIRKHVSDYANPFCYSSIDSIPHNHCALVLGTSKYLSNGHRNQFYTNRINATVQLYFCNKIDYIIVSGDNRNRTYNEPITMFNDLVAAGIPGRKIILDYAGFRTLDSVVRCKEVFGQEKFTIVSQLFHNQRAIYIGRKKEIDAIAFNAESEIEPLDYKVQLREIAARTLMLFDMLTAKQPHFLGEKVFIPTE